MQITAEGRRNNFCRSSELIRYIPSLSNLPSLHFRDNDITGVLDHTFCVEHNAYGEIIQHELKPNGKSMPVSEDTKKEYVRYEETHDNEMSSERPRSFSVHTRKFLLF